MCTNLVLLNAPPVMTLCILMSISRVKARRQETMLCYAWSIIPNRWVILLVTAWKSSLSVQTIVEAVKNSIVILFIIWLIETGFFQNLLYFSMYGVIQIILQTVSSIYLREDTTKYIHTPSKIWFKYWRFMDKSRREQ